MTRILTAFGDRVLARVAPKATAKADTSYEVFCYCSVSASGVYSYWKWCHVVGGSSSCTGCTTKKDWCSN